MKPHRLIIFALSALLLGPAFEVRASSMEEEVIPAEQNVIIQSVLTAESIRASAVMREHAFAPDSFWTKLAQCETANNWSDKGRFAGGLGIMTNSSFPKAAMGTWERYGGEQFAPSPDKATREEQIIVANRISVEGYKQVVYRDPDWARRQGIPAVYLWDQKPVGLGGWGCYKSKSTGKYRMDKPKFFYYENFKDVVLFAFKFNETSNAVHDLQMILNVKVDSTYGPKTRQAHFRYLKKRKLSTMGVPKVKKEVTEASAGGVSKLSVGSEVIKRCPKWEKKIKKYGLPVKDFSYIMWRESRCQPKAIGWNYKKGTSVANCKLAPAAIYKKCYAVRSYDSGLLQINSSWVTVTHSVCGGKRGDMSVLLKVDCNLAVAAHLYANGGISHWKATSGRSSSQ